MTSDSVKSALYIAIPAVVAAAVSSFITYRLTRRQPGRINSVIKLSEKKVSDVLDVEELAASIQPGGKVSLCRCWRSEKWPYCDGAHKQHNKDTGDNIGAVAIVKKKQES